VRRGQQPSLRAGFAALDRLALASAVLGLAAWVAGLPPTLTGALLFAAGLLAGGRLARWRGHLTPAEPLLLVLHVGHGWLAAGLMLLGASQLWPAIPPSAALHSLTVGAGRPMTPAVLTRAPLRHTGRPQAAGREAARPTRPYGPAADGRSGHSRDAGCARAHRRGRCGHGLPAAARRGECLLDRRLRRLPRAVWTDPAGPAREGLGSPKP